MTTQPFLSLPSLPDGFRIIDGEVVTERGLRLKATSVEVAMYEALVKAGGVEPSGASPLRGPSAQDKGEISDGYHTFNELYEHRHALFAIACHFLGGWKSKLHEDETMFPGWFIAGLTTTEGPATYHLPVRLWEAFPGREVERAPAWDGHTAADVVTRLWAHVAAMAGFVLGCAHGRPPGRICPHCIGQAVVGTPILGTMSATGEIAATPGEAGGDLDPSPKTGREPSALGGAE